MRGKLSKSDNPVCAWSHVVVATRDPAEVPEYTNTLKSRTNNVSDGIGIISFLKVYIGFRTNLHIQGIPFKYPFRAGVATSGTPRACHIHSPDKLALSYTNRDGIAILF
jgi:hypothetical protein